MRQSAIDIVLGDLDVSVGEIGRALFPSAAQKVQYAAEDAAKAKAADAAKQAAAKAAIEKAAASGKAADQKAAQAAVAASQKASAASAAKDLAARQQIEKTEAAKQAAAAKSAAEAQAKETAAKAAIAKAAADGTAKSQAAAQKAVAASNAADKAAADKARLAGTTVASAAQDSAAAATRVAQLAQQKAATGSAKDVAAAKVAEKQAAAAQAAATLSEQKKVASSDAEKAAIEKSITEQTALAAQAALVSASIVETPPIDETVYVEAPTATGETATQVNVTDSVTMEDITAKVQGLIEKGFVVISNAMTQFQLTQEKPELSKQYAQIVTFEHPLPPGAVMSKSGPYLTVVGLPKDLSEMVTAAEAEAPQEPTEFPATVPILPEESTEETQTMAQFAPMTLMTKFMPASIGAKWTALPKNQKIAIVGGGIAAAVGIAATVYFVTRKPKQPGV